jgi:hypothetical protein
VPSQVDAAHKAAFRLGEIDGNAAQPRAGARTIRVIEVA